MRKLLYLLLLLPAMIHAQTIHVTTDSTRFCTGTVIHFHAHVSGDSTPHFIWKVNNSTVGVDSSAFTSNTLANGDSVRCLLINSTLDTTYALSNLIRDTVDSIPLLGPIFGYYDAVCVGATITFFDTIVGGTWHVTNPSASVLNGVVTGVSGGPENSSSYDSLIYTVSNTCATRYTWTIVEIDPRPDATFILSYGSDQYDFDACLGQEIMINYGDGVTGGLFYSEYGHVRFDPLGAVAASVGMDYVYCIVTNACGSDTSEKDFTVKGPPQVSSIVCPITTLCSGQSVPLSDSSGTTGWKLANRNATIVYKGMLTGVNPGLDTIYYKAGNECGTTSTSITVNVLPPGAINGSDSLCIGNSITVTDLTLGGEWATSNTNVLTIDQSGNITGISTGVATITYSLSSCNVPKSIAVNPIPAHISGNPVVCNGQAIALQESPPGGRWVVSDTSIMQVDRSGTIYGIYPGETTIQYFNQFGCETTITGTVLPPLPIQALTTHLCSDRQSKFSDSTAGGVWSNVDQSVLIIGSSSGLVTALAPGTDSIIYSLPDGCNAMIMVTVDASPDPVVKENNICIDSPLTLYETGNGKWSCLDTNIHISSAIGTMVGTNKTIANVVYTLINGCTDSGIVRIIDCWQSVSVFPNPFTYELIIECYPSIYTNFQLCNILGQQLISQPILQQITVANTESLPPGMYFISISDRDGSSFTQKLVKE